MTDKKTVLGIFPVWEEMRTRDEDFSSGLVAISKTLGEAELFISLNPKPFIPPKLEKAGKVLKTYKETSNERSWSE